MTIPERLCKTGIPSLKREKKELSLEQTQEVVNPMSLEPRPQVVEAIRQKDAELDGRVRADGAVIAARRVIENEDKRQNAEVAIGIEKQGQTRGRTLTFACEASTPNQ
jgi:hypothetical protein